MTVRAFRDPGEAGRWLDEPDAAGPSRTLGTPRLSLVAATLRHVEAELTGPRSLALLLGAAVPASWPPGEYDRHAQEYFRDRLAAASPADAGWFGWYGITRTAPFASPTLVVAAGFVGPPGEDGTVETGYSVVPEARGLGYATEAVKALLAWALRNGASRVIAHTTPANAASVTVLLRCGFVEDGPGEEPGTVRFATRASAG
ncbi:MAG: GNAT family N-acetyltransferase [Holophagales bacterium]|nr:GNAT family N-acetyltransferase [Holophagales bacterium]